MATVRESINHFSRDGKDYDADEVVAHAKSHLGLDMLLDEEVPQETADHMAGFIVADFEET